MTAIFKKPMSPRDLPGLNQQHLFTHEPISQAPSAFYMFLSVPSDGIFRCVQLVSDNLQFYVKITLSVSALEINVIKIYEVLQASFNCLRKMFWPDIQISA